MSDLEDLARLYVHRMRECEGVDASGLLAALQLRDDALHALIVEVEGHCPYCDPGTCPLDPIPTNETAHSWVVDTPPL